MNATEFSPRERAAGLVVALLLAWPVVRFGILPTFDTTRGDFANYYTASRLLLEGAPLERAYQDFSWFQQQMDRSGIRNQVGGFIPHPPPAALVFLPIAALPALTAKRVWIFCNLILLAICVWGLACFTRLPWFACLVVILCSGFGLLNNFLFGQHYLLVAATVFSGIALAARKRPVIGGLLLGLMAPMKYVGLLFLLYLGWQRRWPAVIAGVATVVAVLILTLLIAGPEPFLVFAGEVLPRHLQGEIQDPFAVQFQSWNSLFRRMFVFDPTLNPNPVTHAPLLFALFSSSVFWLLFAAGLKLFPARDIPDARHRLLFQVGLIPALFLLVSPGGATYHFLLLSLSGAAFCRILLDRGKRIPAAALLGLLLLVNLPHYVKLMPLASGWTTPLAYSRLFFLLLFIGTAVALLKPGAGIRSTIHFRLAAAAALLALIVFSTSARLQALEPLDSDGAEPMMVPGAEFARHLGLIVKQPTLGRTQLVFSYCELLNDQYTLFSLDSGRWSPPKHQNYYSPDLAPDDRSLLAETIVDGEQRIVLSRQPGSELQTLEAGQFPRWLGPPDRFIFARDGAVWQFNAAFMQTPPQLLFRLATEEAVRGLAVSPGGDRIAICVELRDTRRGYALRIYEPERRRLSSVLDSPARIETPAWSPDGNVLLFSWRSNGHRDIFGMRLDTGALTQITSHRGEDTAPVWDAGRRAILFVSDRGRGLEMSTLYRIAVPAELRGAPLSHRIRTEFAGESLSSQ